MLSYFERTINTSVKLIVEGNRAIEALPGSRAPDRMMRTCLRCNTYFDNCRCIQMQKLLLVECRKKIAENPKLKEKFESLGPLTEKEQ